MRAKRISIVSFHFFFLENRNCCAGSYPEENPLEATGSVSFKFRYCGTSFETVWKKVSLESGNRLASGTVMREMWVKDLVAEVLETRSVSGTII